MYKEKKNQKNVIQQEGCKVVKKKKKKDLIAQFHPDLNTESIQTLSVRLWNTDGMANNTLK